MILSYMLDRMEDGHPRPVPDWTRMIRTIQNRTDHYTDRAVQGVMTTSPWEVLLSRMIAKIPLYLGDEKDDVKIMAEAMGHVRDTLEMELAPGDTLKERDACFTASNNGTAKEIIVPCSSSTPLMDLPVGKPLAAWKDVHPVHILYNDSLELCSRWTGRQFVYSDDPPEEVIVSIDVPALILKYIAALKDYDSIPNFPRSQFIRRHLIDNLYEDIVRCWVFRMLEEMVTEGHVDSFYTNNAIVASSVVEAGLRDLGMMTSRIEMKAFYVKDFFMSDLLTWSCPSIQEYVKWFNHSITFPAQRKVAYIQFLTEFPLVRVLMKLNLLSGTVNSRRLIQHVGINLKRYRLMGILSGCQKARLREKLSRQLDELIDLADSVNEETEGPQDASASEEGPGTTA